jgi:hypothetical protein
VSTADGAAPAGNVATTSSGRDKRDKAKKQQRKAASSENGTGMFHKLRVWWEKVLKEASKK